jgi:hypothetical protein
MASILRIKRSGTSGNPSTLGQGELAYSSLADNGSNGGDRLYFGHGTETGGDAANHEIIGGKFFTDQLDHAKGTLTANSALIVDANKKINELLVDNITIDGNTISSTNTNGNIIIDPAGSGFVNVNNSLISNLTNPVSNQDAVTKSYADAKTLSVKDDGNNTDTINLVTGTLDFEGGTGVTTVVSDDKVSFSIGQPVATTDNVTFNNVTVNGVLNSDDITATTMTASGHVVVQGNLTVNGTTTTVNSNTVAIGDSIMVLNNDETGTPSENAGIEIERGTSTNVSILWNEGTDYWQINDGSTTSKIMTAGNFAASFTGILDGGTF